MKKVVQIFLLILVCLLEISPMALSQTSLDEIVANLRVHSIGKMRVERKEAHYYLYIDITLENANEQSVRLTKNRFEFYICHSKHSVDCRDKNPQLVTYIGADSRYGNEDIELTGKQIRDDIQFKIDLGTTVVGIKAMTEIINFLGNPNTESTVFIEAGFNLGLKTEQGWTSVEAGIERLYSPELQDHLPLKGCGG